MSPSEFEFLIDLIWRKISKKDTKLRKAISVQERLTLTVRSLASGDSCVNYFLPIYGASWKLIIL
jgi:hypothetical protein